MVMLSRDGCLFCIFSLFNLLCLVSAQLTGSIVSSGNPFIIIVSITNPTTDHISILKWNNIFDNETQLPVSFKVADDEGTEVLIASTYAMRSGMTNKDIYTLEPNGSFTQNFDLRDYLQNIPKGRSLLYNDVIQISLPSILPGIVHQGSYNVPPEAAADLSAQAPRLGNFSAAGLGDITLNVPPLRLAFRFPIFDPLSESEVGPSNGVRPNAGQCMARNVTGISDAIFDAGVYANSIQMAANNLSSTLFVSYFKNETRAAVGAIANSVASNLKGSGPHTDLYCSDLQGLCDSSSNILGHTFAPSWLGNAYVILCPSAISLGRAPPACSTPAGSQASASTSHFLIHLLLTVNNVVGKVISNSIYGSLACQELLKTPGNSSLIPDPLQNADSFAQLAISHWEYGLGGLPYTGAACLPSTGVASSNNKRTLELDKLQPCASAVEPVTKRQAGDAYYRSIVAQTSECKGAQLVMVQNAAENARALARAAQNSTDPELWRQAFNGNDVVKSHVKNIFATIANWNTSSNPAGVSFRCDAQRRSDACNMGTNANTIGFPKQQQLYIILCTNFFYLPAALPCSRPSTRTPSIQEQAGTILHELLHVQWLVKWSIQDGWSPVFGAGACYNWACVTQNAQNRVLPDVHPNNLPENVATAYEYFAYAARADAADCATATGWSGYVGSFFGLNYGQ